MTRPAGWPCYRNEIPVLAFTPLDSTCSQLAMRGAWRRSRPIEVEHTDEMVRQVDEQLLEIGRVVEGDTVVIIAGSPPGIPGSTNALRVHQMGDAINEVAPAYHRSAERASGLRPDRAGRAARRLAASDRDRV